MVAICHWAKYFQINLSYLLKVIYGQMDYSLVFFIHSEYFKFSGIGYFYSESANLLCDAFLS